MCVEVLRSSVVAVRVTFGFAECADLLKITFRRTGTVESRLHRGVIISFLYASEKRTPKKKASHVWLGFSSILLLLIRLLFVVCLLKSYNCNDIVLYNKTTRNDANCIETFVCHNKTAGSLFDTVLAPRNDQSSRSSLHVVGCCCCCGHDGFSLSTTSTKSRVLRYCWDCGN